MAGHNKWSKVKHIKAAVDAKKGRVFSKIARELTIAAKNGGRDPDMNPRLRSAIAAAKAANMPGDNVDRAIKKGLGELEGAAMEEITYEGYAAGSVAHLFQRKGEIKVPAAAAAEDAVMEAALDAGADDVVSDTDDHTLFTAPEKLYAVAGSLKDRGYSASSIRLVYLPGSTITLTNIDTARAVLKLYETLDDLDDTQNVHANFEIADEIVDQLEP